jgi:hypothetical protein
LEYAKYNLNTHEVATHFTTFAINGKMNVIFHDFPLISINFAILIYSIGRIDHQHGNVVK